MSKVLTLEKRYFAYWWQFDNYISPAESDYEDWETLGCILPGDSFDQVNKLIDEYDLDNVKEYLYAFIMHMEPTDRWFAKRNQRESYDKMLAQQKDLLAFKKIYESWLGSQYQRKAPEGLSFTLKRNGKTVLKISSSVIVLAILQMLKKLMGTNLVTDKLNTNQVLPYYDERLIQQKYAYHLDQFLIKKTGLGTDNRGNKTKRHLLIAKIYSITGINLVTDDKAREYVLDQETAKEVRKLIKRIGEKINDPNYRRFY